MLLTFSLIIASYCFPTIVHGRGGQERFDEDGKEKVMMYILYVLGFFVVEIVPY